MDTTGKIHVIADTKVVSDKFQSREVVLLISDNPTYPQYVTFQFAQDKCGLLDMFQVGQDVTVSFNLRGRSWVSPQGEQRYFNTLEGWKITPIAGQPKGGANTAQIPSTPVDFNSLDDSGEKLPF